MDENRLARIESTVAYNDYTVSVTGTEQLNLTSVIQAGPMHQVSSLEITWRVLGDSKACKLRIVQTYLPASMPLDVDVGTGGRVVLSGVQCEVFIYRPKQVLPYTSGSFDIQVSAMPSNSAESSAGLTYTEKAIVPGTTTVAFQIPARARQVTLRSDSTVKNVVWSLADNGGTQVIKTYEGTMMTEVERTVEVGDSTWLLCENTAAPILPPFIAAPVFRVY